jgi:hypothetical protein
LALQAPHLEMLVLEGAGVPSLPALPARLRRLALINTPAARDLRTMLQLPALEQLCLTEHPGPVDSASLKRLPASCKWKVHAAPAPAQGWGWYRQEEVPEHFARGVAGDWCDRIIRRGGEFGLVVNFNAV